MRFYEALLRLYPAGFRDEYRAELVRTFAERTGHMRGPLGSIAKAAAAIADVLPNAAAAHVDILRQDLLFATRSLRRTPGFAITAILVVALGVGANTAVFSLADFVFVRPLPYHQPDQLVKLWQYTPDGQANNASPANERDWREQSHSFVGMAPYTMRSQNLVGSGEPRELQAAMATPGVFTVLGVTPLLGRAFTTSDLETGPCVVLSEGLWRSRFAADPRVIGTTIRLNGTAHTVTGVMPGTFQFPYPNVEAWPSLKFEPSNYEDRDDTYLEVIARLKPGVSAKAATQDLDAVSRRLQLQYAQNKDITVLLIPLHGIPERSRLLVLALCGAALCVLLLSCANLASLFLARGAYRSHELAVRSALGAGRERLVRQLVTESLTVAIVGGVIGVAAAAILLPLLSMLVPSQLPVASRATLDLRALATAIGLTLVTGFAFGLMPAMRAGRTSALGALKSDSRSGGGRTQRLRAGLVVVEVAASVVLLVTSGLLIRAVWRIQTTDPGFVPSHVLAVRTVLPFDQYPLVAKRLQYYDRVLSQVRSVPGVQSAAFVTGLPMSMRGGIWTVTIPGREAPEQKNENNVSLRFATPDLFRTMQVPIRRGRDFNSSDAGGALPTAIVSESFVRQHFAAEDPLGRTFRVMDTVRTIVGVVGDVKVRGFEMPSEPQLYLPAGQVPDSNYMAYPPKELVVRFAPPLTAQALTPLIRRFVASADPNQPISRVRMLEELVADESAPRVTQIRLLGALTALALIIAGLGLHGLLAFTVSMRSRELGIRRALGASVGQVVGPVLREGLTLVLAGLAIGLVVGYAIARAMGALLVEVSPADPLTLAAAAALCLLTAAIGFLRPTLNAANVDPLVALRAE